MEAAPGFEPGIKVLQTSALPLGYAALGPYVIPEDIYRERRIAVNCTESHLYRPCVSSPIDPGITGPVYAPPPPLYNSSFSHSFLPAAIKKMEF